MSNVETIDEFVQLARTKNGWTPDVPLLDTQDYWYVFTYAERRGKTSSYFLAEGMEDCTFMCFGWTKSRLYNILKVEEKTSTFHLANMSGADRILGEVWKIPTAELLELDAEERNQLRSRRFQLPIITPGGVEVLCWVYLIDPKYVVTGGHKISLHKRYCYVGSEKLLDV